MIKTGLFLVTALLGLNSAYACVLTMSAVDGLPPFFEKQNDGSNSWQGQSVDWLVQISQNINCKAKLLELPWGRALHMLQKGQLDMMTNLSKTKERERYLEFIGPHSVEKLVLLLSTSERPIRSLEEISQLKGQIAMLSNGYYGEEFEYLYQHNAEFRQRIVLVSSSKILKMMLQTQRVVGLIEDEEVIRHWTLKQKLQSNNFHPPLTVHSSPVYIGLSKKALTPYQREQIRRWWQSAEVSKANAE